jgi:hypothetical protein
MDYVALGHREKSPIEEVWEIYRFGLPSVLLAKTLNFIKRKACRGRHFDVSRLMLR